jgi:[CysO sulfur-carrier protein]-S-L-cysteine hydrolase
VIVRRAALDVVVSHARETAPAECCGVLLGAPEIVMDARPARNLATDPNRFLIDPKDHIDARREARAHDLDVVGFYHSHPRSAAVPSPTDFAEASYPEHLYLIVGLASEQPEVRLYRLTAGAFLELTFNFRL